MSSQPIDQISWQSRILWHDLAFKLNLEPYQDFIQLAITKRWLRGIINIEGQPKPCKIKTLIISKQVYEPIPKINGVAGKGLSK